MFATRLSAAAAATLAPLACCAVAGAAPGSLTYIKDGNVFIAPADGGDEFQVTDDATAGDPYLSASRTASGTIVAIRGTTAHQMDEAGRDVAPPLGLGSFASGVGTVSEDGAYLAFEELDSCSVWTPACVNTAFVSLATGARLPGYGLEMHNPTWSGDSVIGAVAGGVAIAGPQQPDETEWFGYGPTPIPHQTGSTDTVAAAAASPDGTRVAVVTTAGTDGGRFLLWFTAPRLGAPVFAACKLGLPAGSDPHPVWAPDGSAVAWEDTDGIHELDIVDLSGDNCGANRSGRTISATGSRPTWSAAPYDPPATGPTEPERSKPSFRVAASAPLKRALRRGLRVRIVCPDPCFGTATATVDRRTARRYRTARTVGRGSGASTFTLRFTPQARRRLLHARRIRLTVAVTLRHNSDSTRSRRAVTLR
jgi:hypothetical protein